MGASKIKGFASLSNRCISAKKESRKGSRCHHQGLQVGHGRTENSIHLSLGMLAHNSRQGSHINSSATGLEDCTTSYYFRPLGARIQLMELHADLSQRAVLDTNALNWNQTPMAGVERRLLDRNGGEVARAVPCQSG